MSGSREAIVAAVLTCCVQVSAADPAVPDNLGSFLKDGWGVSAAFPQQTGVTIHFAPDPESNSVPPVVKAAVAPLELPNALIEKGVVVHSDVVHSDVVHSDVVHSDVVAASSDYGDETSQTDLIYLDQNQKQGLTARPSFESLWIDSAPSVNRLMLGQKSKSVAIHKATGGDSGTICAADPIDAAQLAVRGPQKSSEKEIEYIQETCDLVAVPDVVSATSVGAGSKSIPQQPEVDMTASVVPSHILLPNQEDMATFFQNIQKPAGNGQSAASESLLELPSLEFSLSDRDVDSVSDQRERSSVPSGMDAAAGIHLFEGRTEAPQSEAGDSLSRAAGLWELAQRSLHQARESAGNKTATESRDFAFEAFRLCAAAKDAAERTSWCTKSFLIAVEAVRESEDFCKSVDGTSQSELRQLIASHHTSVMKGVEQSKLSSHDAAFRYMTFARCKLIEAACGMPAASEALMLLGAAEAELSAGSASYKHAIAVMLQRAAIEIDPVNHETHLALGMTLSKQGLSEQACWSLQKSVEIRPTREAYQALLEIAQQRGNDAQTAGYLAKLKQYPHSIERSPLETETLANAGETPSDPSGQGTAESNEKDDTRIGWRSLIPFMR
ncbi:MAG: hypothetical protein OSA98_16735 [Rubripirellula sp.]|nr:hypothetical protein [Rubripirellula sp.]